MNFHYIPILHCFHMNVIIPYVSESLGRHVNSFICPLISKFLSCNLLCSLVFNPIFISDWKCVREWLRSFPGVYGRPSFPFPGAWKGEMIDTLQLTVLCASRLTSVTIISHHLRWNEQLLLTSKLCFHN